MDPVIPLPLYVVRDILNFLSLASGPPCDVLRGVLEALLDPVFVVVETFFVAVPVFFCDG